MRYFSVLDSKAGLYATLFQAPTPGVAERSFSEAVNDSQTVIHKSPDDFHLYEIGEFDEETGVFVPLPVPVHIVSAYSLLKA